jgi:hypothetical protein
MTPPETTISFFPSALRRAFLLQIGQSNELAARVDPAGRLND